MSSAPVVLLEADVALEAGEMLRQDTSGIDDKVVRSLFTWK